MPSRRSDIEMNADQIRAYLNAQHRLILVSNGPDGYPHPMPMSFVLDDQDRYVVVTFRKSQKVRNLQRDPKAGLLVESGTAYADLKAVMAQADAEIIDDLDEVRRAMTALHAKQSGGIGVEQGQATAPKRVVIRFTPHAFVSWDHSKLGGAY